MCILSIGMHDNASTSQNLWLLYFCALYTNTARCQIMSHVRRTGTTRIATTLYECTFLSLPGMMEFSVSLDQHKPEGDDLAIKELFFSQNSGRCSFFSFITRQLWTECMTTFLRILFAARSVFSFIVFQVCWFWLCLSSIAGQDYVCLLK